jgi:TfoX/Sxy family transcriptional regulator of competence genes
MKWRKSPDALVQAFDHCLPIVAGVQRKAMFGYPCAFLNGHLFCGLHQDSIIVRLPEARRDALVAEGASVFEPMPGQAMREYVLAPAEIVADRERLRALLGEALSHASSLAQKPKKPSAAKRATASKRKAAPARKTAPAKKTPGRKISPAKKGPVKKAPAKKKATRKASPKKKRSR